LERAPSFSADARASRSLTDQLLLGAIIEVPLERLGAFVLRRDQALT